MLCAYCCACLVHSSYDQPGRNNKCAMQQSFVLSHVWHVCDITMVCMRRNHLLRDHMQQLKSSRWQLSLNVCLLGLQGCFIWPCPAAFTCSFQASLQTSILAVNHYYVCSTTLSECSVAACTANVSHLALVV